jgi:hypothetical protein
MQSTISTRQRNTILYLTVAQRTQRRWAAAAAASDHPTARPEQGCSHASLPLVQTTVRAEQDGMWWRRRQQHRCTWSPPTGELHNSSRSISFPHVVLKIWSYYISNIIHLSPTGGAQDKLHLTDIIHKPLIRSYD